MSTSSQPSENEGQAGNPAQTGGSGAKVRQGFLFILLLLGIAALVWEFLIIKPKFDEDWEQVTVLLDENQVADKDNLITQEIVVERLGKEPSVVKEPQDGHRLEIYRYRRGIPIRHYSIAIGYRKMLGKWVIQQAWDNNEAPPESEWISTAVQSTLNEEDLKSIPPAFPTGAGGGAAGGRNARGGNNDEAKQEDDEEKKEDSSDDSQADESSGDDTSGDDAAADDTAADDSSGSASGSEDKSSDQ